LHEMCARTCLGSHFADCTFPNQVQWLQVVTLTPRYVGAPFIPFALAQLRDSGARPLPGCEQAVLSTAVAHSRAKNVEDGQQRHQVPLSAFCCRNSGSREKHIRCPPVWLLSSQHEREITPPFSNTNHSNAHKDRLGSAQQTPLVQRSIEAGEWRSIEAGCAELSKLR
jgi:hypothetical protein